MTRYAIRHETLYGYRAPVDFGLHVLRLTPLNNAVQRPLSYGWTIDPQPDRIEGHTDHFGNAFHCVAVESIHDRFSVTLDANVEVTRPSVSDKGPPWEKIRDSMCADGFPVPPGVAEFVYASPVAIPDKATTEYAIQSFAEEKPIVSALRDLTARIHRDFKYAPNLTNVSTKAAEVLSMRHGVCQDFAHLMIAGLRGIGLPARYVSGYVYTYPKNGDCARPGSDATHAWVSVWCGPELGWIEFDPTNNLLVENEHVVLAYGRDFSDATPLRGVILGGGSHTLKVAVIVKNLDSPENSTPATEHQQNR